MDQRVVLITGAARGIGSATARVFADAGWHVVGVDQVRGEALACLARFIQADVSDQLAQQHIFDQVVTHEGRLDALVNNAAIVIRKPLLETTPHDWDKVMSINLRSVFLGVQQGYPLLRESRGAIVNVSSVHAVATACDHAAYAASKGGLLALTRAMALEFSPDGVRVNAILPGAVDTGMLRSAMAYSAAHGDDVEDFAGVLARRIPLGRVGNPGEIGRAILFLADNEQSSFLTGQVLIVDGGSMAKLST